MAISTALPISLSTVISEIGLPTASSLLDCFANANAGGFNPTYGTISSNNLQAFRGYSHACTTVASFPFRPNTSSFLGWTSASSACSSLDTYEVSYYHDGAAPQPANGDKIYSDSGGCTAFNGAGKWYKYRDGGTFYRFTISTLGVVGSKAVC
jgi:hypothetical protein